MAVVLSQTNSFEKRSSRTIFFFSISTVYMIITTETISITIADKLFLKAVLFFNHKLNTFKRVMSQCTLPTLYVCIFYATVKAPHPRDIKRIEPSCHFRNIRNTICLIYPNNSCGAIRQYRNIKNLGFGPKRLLYTVPGY